MKRIGIFGVTANPPHWGHVAVVNEALKQCDEVWVTPVYIHPFGKKFIDYIHRIEMLKLIFSFDEKIKLVELDKEYYEKYGKTPYSYDLLKQVQALSVDNLPQLIIGADNYQPQVWQKFYNFDKIESEFGVIVVEDKGFHSTDIRLLCDEQKWIEVEKLCGIQVMSYLKSHRFYQV